ncbi:glycine/betaine/sarcosine/D-proline family reductase selenoprotein B [Salibacterium salarium]|uniref:Glycine/betaine/sarcosine/D-proline family reductase selenoprotein B n=1 Tax=Salibacterium salarium TaxID=284579 RepID=A0A3R9PGE8_9BACI|nr:glycine/betaine/sarcosine/D-proline family reductase selenoprotein B [Salibacterium salarium]
MVTENQQIRVVHYLNQFFGGIGGEDQAHIAPTVKLGAVGPGRLLEQSTKKEIQVAATIICGDNYFSENPSAPSDILEMIKELKPDAVVAGPAFAAGRYGEACTAVCKEVKENLNIPVITGLAADSPSLGRFRRTLDIAKTASSAVDMKNSMPHMGTILMKKLKEEELSKEEIEWLYTKGLKKNVLLNTTASQRAVDMVLAKHKKQKWETEVPMIVHESVSPAMPVYEDKFRIGLITDGGLVSKGNPEGMTSVRSTKWCSINVDKWDELTEKDVDVNHNGYDSRYVKENPNRLVPLDIAKEMERSGEIKLHPYIYSTAGVATAIENAERFGKEIAEELKQNSVQAAILTST